MISCRVVTGKSGLRQRCAPSVRQALVHRHLLWLLALFAWLPPFSARAASPELIERGSYDQAIQSIPFDRLTDSAQERIWKIVSQPSIYRRLPVTQLQSDPDLYLFLVRHPEIIVNMWELMGVTKVKVRRTGDFTFDANDGAGTTGRGELIYGDKETHLVLGEGSYEGPVLKRQIHGRCLVILKSGYTPDDSQKAVVTHRLDMFVQLDDIGADLVARTFHPLVGKSADHNFVETSRFFGQIAQAAETRPTGMQQLAGRLTNVAPEIRERFAGLAADVHARSSNGSLIQVKSVPERAQATGER
jgi:hypothetical protein